MSQEEIRKFDQDIQSYSSGSIRRSDFSDTDSGRTSFLLGPIEEHDPVLKGLQSQLSHLRQANQQMRQMASSYAELERSLATLLPALEIQIKGWDSEIRTLQSNSEESDQTYASVVDTLEQRIRAMRQDYESRIQALEEALARSNRSSSEAPQAPEADGNDSNPFRDLNIFGL